MSSEKDPITEKIIGCAMKVSNVLGCGFLEKVYENALVIELEKNGLIAQQQRSLFVYYDGLVVGQYTVDILVCSKVILELKAVSSIDVIHMAQLLNYLKASQLQIGLILNFGTPRLEIKRLKL
jgi:GxxExxY protein